MSRFTAIGNGGYHCLFPSIVCAPQMDKRRKPIMSGLRQIAFYGKGHREVDDVLARNGRNVALVISPVAAKMPLIGGM
ncbi:hypothetical protein [Mesorhizobium kowhaii]|nr:hypothetical protein [Mesorhizobium kowhaii]PZV38147.1 hypothetical protein B5V02_12680 [Mesorhizobium kowhaii]